MEKHNVHPGPSDRQFINLSEDYEVRDWSKHFNITPEELKEAVKNAGSRATEVQAWLDNKNATKSRNS